MYLAARRTPPARVSVAGDGCGGGSAGTSQGGASDGYATRHDTIQAGRAGKRTEDATRSGRPPVTDQLRAQSHTKRSDGGDRTLTGQGVDQLDGGAGGAQG